MFRRSQALDRKAITGATDGQACSLRVVRLLFCGGLRASWVAPYQDLPRRYQAAGGACSRHARRPCRQLPAAWPLTDSHSDMVWGGWRDSRSGRTRRIAFVGNVLGVTGWAEITSRTIRGQQVTAAVKRHQPPALRRTACGSERRARRGCRDVCSVKAAASTTGVHVGV